jgi:NADH dehydrogenase FAD-containing subunit
MRWLRPLSVLASIPFSNNIIKTKKQANNETNEKPTILVAGYGWGAHAFLSEIDPHIFDVTVVSERDRRLNQNEMISPLRASYTPALVPVITDTCVSIDSDKSIVQGTKQQYPYDYLVIATGSEVNDFGIAGVRTFCSPCKTGEDMEAIRASVKAGITKATVLGAGPTGVELAMSLRCHGVPSVRIVEGGNQILPGFSDTMRSRTLSHLKAKGIDLQLDRPIQAITADAIVTKTGSLSVSSTELLVWTCGVRPVSFVRSIGGSGGRALTVDDHLCFSASNIYAIGDSIAGRGPPTAQNARQQGSYLAQHFNAGFKTKEPYRYQELGRCLDLTEGLLIEVLGCSFFIPNVNMAEMLWMVTV